MRMMVKDDTMLEMAKLAVLASIPVGMGHLHHQPNLKKEDIQVEINDRGLFIDYYQGRMVKFRAWKKEDGSWDVPDTISSEYESWVRKYHSYEDLAVAAMSSLHESGQTNKAS